MTTNRRFHVFLVKPSKYDDDGYVMQHWRAVLPSNTLACLHGLTEDVRERGLLDNLDLEVHAIDEAVSRIPVETIAELHRRPGHTAVVALVGVQTNQFCRAADVALALRSRGVPVLVGGFHVSGVLALFPGISPEIQELVDAGVSVVAGEVEEHWADILRDVCTGRLKPIYRFLDDLPDLSSAPRPIINKKYLRHFLSSNFGTIDCSRGCPFNCSFCTIINVQGRKSRHRSPESVAETIRKNYAESKIHFYFFTDDDFARNPAWEGVFDALIEAREKDGIPVDFMIQVDVLSYKIPGFVEKAARAGCRNVFIGMESINPQNIKEAGKAQNKVKDYRNLIDAWHRAKVSTHVGYIIGFSGDTEDSVARDVEKLKTEVQPHRVSFFMLTPLPGSQDHKLMVEQGAPMSSDYNTFDSFHESMPHPKMKDGAWTRAYLDAWRSFYSFENMKAILERTDRRNYWDVLKNFYWYKNSALNEGTHPMIAGFFRLKDRRARPRGLGAGGPVETPAPPGSGGGQVPSGHHPPYAGDGRALAPDAETQRNGASGHRGIDPDARGSETETKPQDLRAQNGLRPGGGASPFDRSTVEASSPSRKTLVPPCQRAQRDASRPRGLLVEYATAPSARPGGCAAARGPDSDERPSRASRRGRLHDLHDHRRLVHEPANPARKFLVLFRASCVAAPRNI